MVEWKLGKWGSKEKKQIDKYEDLAAKIYADGKLDERLGMMFSLHLALEVGDLDVLDFIDSSDIPDNRKKMLVQIKKLSTSTDPLERVKAYEYQLQIMDLVLRTAAIPWLTGGEMDSAAELLDGWEGLYAKSKVTIISVKNIIHRSRAGETIQMFMDKTALVDNLQKTLTLYPFRYGRLISDLSWKKADIRPNQIAVFFNMAGQDQGRAPIRKTDPLFGNQDQNLRQIIREEMDRR